MLKRLRHSERRHATGICTPYSHLYATSVHSFPELKTSQKLLCGVVKKADIWDSHSFNQHGIYPRLSTTHPSPPPINPPPPQWLCSSPAGLYRPPLPPSPPTEESTNLRTGASAPTFLSTQKRLRKFNLINRIILVLKELVASASHNQKRFLSQAQPYTCSTDSSNHHPSSSQPPDAQKDAGCRAAVSSDRSDGS